MMLLSAGLGKETESSREKQQLFAGGGAQQRENEDGLGSGNAGPNSCSG